MWSRISLVLLLTLLPAFAIERIDLPAMVDPQLPALLAIYKDLHAHPELSHFEDHTSAFLASQLREAGYEVTEHVGAYPNGSKAFGIVAIMKNGSGSTVLFRTELDALPVDEKTGLRLRQPRAHKERSRAGCVRDACLRTRSAHDVVPRYRTAHWPD